MTKLYVWPDATYLDADEYNEVEFNHKGEDLITLDLQAIADGRTVLVDTGGFFTVVPVFEYRLSELLRAEHQFKTLTTMFRNYRNTMREYSWQIPHLKETIEQQQKDYGLAMSRITDLEASPPSAEVRRISKELSDVIASKDQEIKTILQARDQWVKELQGKLREATESEDGYTANSELAEENRRLKSQLAGATARIAKHREGYGVDWRARAEAAEAELAKTVEISDTMEGQIERLRKQLNTAEDKATFCAKERDECAAKVDSLRKERNRYGDLLTKHGVCTDCGDMYEHHEDEPLASCSCHTAEWGSGVSTPYMALQRALREARDTEHSQAERADDAEQRAQDLRNEMDAMKHEIATVISRLQEIE